MGGELLHATSAERPRTFYASVMRLLQVSRVPFLVGGTFAFEQYGGFTRGTKDLDLFLCPEDWPRAAAAANAHGFDVELTFSHWLGKINAGDLFVDCVFAGGNGLGPVEPDWFLHGVPSNVCGVPVLLCPLEELICSKSFVMERERFDGADVLHLLRNHGATLDWARLLERYGGHWHVLLAHLVLFDFVYPGERQTVPHDVLRTLSERLLCERQRAGGDRICRGPLLSRLQYLVDITEWGYADPRLQPQGTLTQEQVDEWTEAGLREGRVAEQIEPC